MAIETVEETSAPHPRGWVNRITRHGGTVLASSEPYINRRSAEIHRAALVRAVLDSPEGQKILAEHLATPLRLLDEALTNRMFGAITPDEQKRWDRETETFLRGLMATTVTIDEPIPGLEKL